MKTTIRTLKNNQRELRSFAQILGLSAGNWTSLYRNLITAEQGFTISSDGASTSVVPTSILDSALPAQQVRQLFLALLQPGTSLLSSRIMFVPQLLTVLANCINQKPLPILSKGVSYPSSLQRNQSTGILVSDNVWLLDLFSGGVSYQRQVSTNNSFFVVDTTIYEGWNRFTNKEINAIFTNLPNQNQGRAVVARFLQTLAAPTYKYVLENCRVRGTYLSAIAQTLNLPPVIQMSNVLTDTTFQKYLSQVLETIKPREAFCYEGDTNARDFAPFVYAEEMYLRSRYQVDICTGPIREDLPLNFSVLEICQQLGTPPTPILWYTRPNTLPSLSFSDSLDTTAALLQNNSTARLFVTENLLKLGLLDPNLLPSTTPTTLAKILYSIMQTVQTSAQQLLQKEPII